MARWQLCPKELSRRSESGTRTSEAFHCDQEILGAENIIAEF
jgi:hypothetical protein